MLNHKKKVDWVNLVDCVGLGFINNPVHTTNPVYIVHLIDYFFITVLTVHLFFSTLLICRVNFYSTFIACSVMKWAFVSPAHSLEMARVRTCRGEWNLILDIESKLGLDQFELSSCCLTNKHSCQTFVDVLLCCFWSDILFFVLRDWKWLVAWKTPLRFAPPPLRAWADFTQFASESMALSGGQLILLPSCSKSF